MSAPRRPVRAVALAGVRIIFDPTLLLIAPFIALSFWARFDATYGAVSAGGLALAASAGFFASILAHELAHAWSARALGLRIEEITLHVFGGATRISSEPARPRDEFVLAAVGPWTSIVLGCGLGLVSWTTAGTAASAVSEVSGELAWLNLLLGAFNVLPGAPLDGGRMLEALAWRITGDRLVAARLAARLGQVLAGVVVLLGVTEAVLTADGFLGGLWLVLIGWFLWRGAEAERAFAFARTQLSALRAGDLHSTAVSVRAGASLRLVTAVCVYPTDFVAVLDDSDEVIGVVTLADVAKLRQGEAELLRVDAIMTPLADLDAVEATAPAIELLRALGPRPVRVMEGDHVVSLVGASDVAAAFRTRGAHRAPTPLGAQPARPRPSMRTSAARLGVLAGSAAVVVAAALVVPLPVTDVRPGPALNLANVIRSGGPLHRPSGRLLLTSVQVANPTLAGVARVMLNPEHDLSFGTTGVPAGITPADYIAYQREVFQMSVRTAAAVAWREAGYPVEVWHQGAVILAVNPGGPADGKLRVGDVVLTIDGHPVTGAADLVAEVRAGFPDIAVSLTIRRGAQRERVLVVPAVSSVSGTPVLGVSVEDAPPVVRLPFSLTTTADVAGPSAGLMAALALYTLTSGEDVTGGRTLAGTGTIDASGTVGPVGGVSQKVIAAARAGATVFLVPAANAATARDAAAGRHLRVVAVSSFSGALRALRALT